MIENGRDQRDANAAAPKATMVVLSERLIEELDAIARRRQLSRSAVLRGAAEAEIERERGRVAVGA